jgi:SAM-dependent methyltransferase
VTEGTDELIERFLAGHAERTRQAYRIDLEDFARFRDRAWGEAVAELLAGRRQGHRLALDFAVELRGRGLAPATVRRRLTTLSSLVGLAGRLGAVDWSLVLPTEEEVAAAARAAVDGGRERVPYFLPRHPIESSEIDRLDLQHYALREHLGANHLAPLERPDSILDVGCGTGLWAYELGAEFPEALVVGFDLVPSRRPWPAAYHFVRGNLLQGLPFADDGFDFVHQRLLLPGVPVRAWAGVVRELVRVTRPGGRLELLEGAFEIGPAGPATRRLFEMTWRVGRDGGLDTTGVIYRNLGEQPRRAGLVDVELREIPVPVGEWGGRIGSLLATDFRALFLRLAPVFEARFGITEHDCRDLVTAMHQEWEEHHTEWLLTAVQGRKPD